MNHPPSTPNEQGWSKYHSTGSRAGKVVGSGCKSPYTRPVSQMAMGRPQHQAEVNTPRELGSTAQSSPMSWQGRHLEEAVGVTEGLNQQV